MKSTVVRLILMLAVICSITLAHAQPPRQPREGNPVATPFSTDVQREWLSQVMPEADRFSDEKAGEPPVWEAYQVNPDSGQQTLIGWVFLTADVPPEERGFSAPIAMLAGLNTDNQITGFKILHYVESYTNTVGDFAADPVFQAQYYGKSILDEFQVRQDIDGISGATVTSFAISRGLREAGRRVAAAYNGFSLETAVDRARKERILEQLAPYTWDQLIEENIVHQLTMPIPGGQELQLTLTYMGDPALGEYWIGQEAYARSERDAAARLGGSEMILLAVGGSGYQQFRQDRLTLQQGNMPTRRITANRLVTAGNADAGMIAGRAEFAGALVIDDSYDITETINIGYQPLGSLEPYEIEFQPVGLGMQLAQNIPVLSEDEIADIERWENSAIRQFLADPPWGVTAWEKVVIIGLIFALVLIAFFTKNAKWRWAALLSTLVYLGFMEAGFLSVAHITGVLTQGPSAFLNNLPVTMIVVFTLVTTLIWGRVFCSSLCPFGAVQDIITKLTPRAVRNKLPKIPVAIHEKALYIKYGILAFIILMAVVFNNVQIFQYFEPFGTLFFLSGSVVLFAILAAFLLASFVIPRFYCRYVCPLGAALGVISLVAPKRIKRVPQCELCTVCEKSCPTGAIKREKIDFKECVRCDVCEDKLIKKAGTCRHDMSKIIVRHKEMSTS